MVQASGRAASATLESAVKTAVCFALGSIRGKRLLLNLGGTTSLRPITWTGAFCIIGVRLYSDEIAFLCPYCIYFIVTAVNK